MSGSMNWAIALAFDDGVEWIFRSPHSGRHAFLGEKLALRMLSSEAATLKYLRAHADYPVPEVVAYRYDFFPKGATVTEYEALRLTKTSVYLTS